MSLMNLASARRALALSCCHQWWMPSSVQRQPSISSALTRFFARLSGKDVGACFALTPLQVGIQRAPRLIHQVDRSFLTPLCPTVIHPALRLAWRASSNSQETSLTRQPAKSAKCEDSFAAQVGLSLHQVADHVPLVLGQLARGKERLRRNGDAPHGIAQEELMIFLEPTAEPGQSGAGLLFVAGTGEGIKEKLKCEIGRDCRGAYLATP